MSYEYSVYIKFKVIADNTDQVYERIKQIGVRPDEVNIYQGAELQVTEGGER